MLDRRQGGRRLSQRHALEEHVLIDARERRSTRGRERFGGAADGFALALGLAAVGERRVDHDI